ncbi:MAG: hypothetical protein Q7S04_00225 [Candidatus Moranbacteria bacterium]|nr:hypothetical protein [Candidatus Moranbacteria bacterium]
MKSLKKFITGGLIVALASLAGSFCLHPMSVQAEGGDSIDMSAMHMNEQGVVDSTHSMQSSDASAASMSTCTFDCISTMPQVTVTKKTSASSILALAAVSPVEQPRLLEFSSGPTDLTGTQPLPPDILFSVVKRE